MWKDAKKKGKKGKQQGLNMVSGWRPVEKNRKRKKECRGLGEGKPGLVAIAAGGARSEGTAGSPQNPMMTGRNPCKLLRPEENWTTMKAFGWSS